jgi:hypothetical protein
MTRKQNVRPWTGFVQLRIQSGAGLHDKEIEFWFSSKAKDISPAKELSASHERLSTF